MSDIQWTAELLQPTELEPNSTVDIVVHYNNQNEYDHHLRTVLLSPTWDLTQEFESSDPVNIEVPSGETKRLPAIEAAIPQGIGGKQGFRVGVEVRRLQGDHSSEYQEEWNDTVFRLPVSDFDKYRPILCVSGNDEGDTTLRRLIHNWGFDVQEVYEQENVITAFKENEDTPIAVFGAVFPGNDDSSSRHLLSSAVSTALSSDTVAIVFKHTNADLPSLPDECIIIDFDPSDELRLEKESGPLLLGVRSLEETGQMSNFVRWMKKAVEKGVNKPKELLNDWVNQVILSAIGATAFGEDIVAMIKDIFWSRSSSIPGGIKVLAIERFNEGEPNVERITFVAQKDLNLFGWTMETEFSVAATYHFDDVHLATGEMYTATNSEFGFLDYEAGDTITVYNAYNQVVLEEPVSRIPLESALDSHRGVFRVIDEHGNPIEGEPVTVVAAAGFGGFEENFETDTDGEVVFGVTTDPTDVLPREVTVRDHTRSIHIERGTVIVKFTINGDGSVDSTIVN